MKEQFQAKDIRGALNINQRRFQYITEKMRIDPDIVESKGSGQANIYSLHNFLDIAFAHHLSATGLNPSGARFTLEHINTVDKKRGIGIYDPSAEYFIYRLHIWNEIHPPLLYFEGIPPDHIMAKIKEAIEPFDEEGEPLSEEEYLKESITDGIRSFSNEISYIPERLKKGPAVHEGGEKRYLAEELFFQILEHYLTLNLGRVRDKVFRYAAK